MTDALVRDLPVGQHKGWGWGSGIAIVLVRFSTCHSGAMRSIEPGISNFRVWSFGPSRNDKLQNHPNPSFMGLA